MKGRWAGVGRERYDLVVIGGGPAGYAGAFEAARLGAMVALVEAGRLGGTCLHYGCIPTKCLLHTARVAKGVRGASRFGVTVQGDPLIDLSRAQAWKERVIKKQLAALSYRVRELGIALYEGFGYLAEPGPDLHVVTVSGSPGGSPETSLTAPRVLLAAGSREISLSLDGVVLPGSAYALSLERIPATMAVVGGGAVGVELASIFSAFGSRVTLIEALPGILPAEDEALASELARLLSRSGIRILAGTRLKGAVLTGEGYTLALEGPPGEIRELTVESAVTAVGRRPDSSGAGLDAAGIVLGRDGAVQVDRRYATTVPGIFAAGDLIGGYQLAHVASAEGEAAASAAMGPDASRGGLGVAGQEAGGGRTENGDDLKKATDAGPDDRVDYRAVPRAVYGFPELAAVGMTEREALALGCPLAAGTAPLAGNPRAYLEGEQEGRVKVVARGDTGEVLGVHILGAGAAELIAAATPVLRARGTLADLAGFVYAHPTFAESLGEAARAAIASAR
ncbi:MAG: NAD(P)/FAD-dependent oxidoreductase [Firmicutes bacterium]|nr:NAD(P)/FAD-dependent oxidoreductase [Bacillota bacterium]